MNKPFRLIGIVGRQSDERIRDTITQVKQCFDRHGIDTIYGENATAITAQLQAHNQPAHTLLMVIGGDGSLLHASRALRDSDIPLLGINQGKLGFLTDISPDEIQQSIDTILMGQYTIEERFLLRTVHFRQNKPIATGVALNDVVLNTGGSPRLLEFTLSVNQEFVYRQYSDGIIIATPTGSTAYAISCGGPIMHPGLGAIVLVPVCPHTLSSRPLVVTADSDIEVAIGDYDENEMHPLLSCDGEVSFSLLPGDSFSVKRHEKKLCLLHPPHHNFYAACRDKLGWNYYGVSDD